MKTDIAFMNIYGFISEVHETMTVQEIAERIVYNNMSCNSPTIKCIKGRECRQCMEHYVKLICDTEGWEYTIS